MITESARIRCDPVGGFPIPCEDACVAGLVGLSQLEITWPVAVVLGGMVRAVALLIVVVARVDAAT